MALIKCTECGKEVSDKASVCIHCGYPIHSNEVVNVQVIPDLDTLFDNIQNCADLFLNNLDKYDKHFDNMYVAVKGYIDQISALTKEKSLDEKKTINNKILSLILEITTKCSCYCSWMTYKKYYELVDFENVSAGTLKNLAEKIYEDISYVNHYQDGSSGNSEHISLWYPLYKVLKYGTNDIIQPLLKELDKIGAFGNKRYVDVSEMISKHSDDNFSIEALFNNDKTTAKTPTDNEQSNSNDALEDAQEKLKSAQERKDALIKRLEEQKKSEIKSKAGGVIWSIAWTIICIWSFSASEEGSLGLLILLSLVCAVGGWGALIFTNGSVEQMENDIKVASKSVEEYQRLVNIRLANIKAENERLKSEEALKHPKCPMCGSTNTQIISTLNRAVSIGMVGLASSKIGKQYECKNCKHKW